MPKYENLEVVEVNEIYDVAIIGAGPAGLAVAISIQHYSKKFGYNPDIVLVDKDRFPGMKKPCGGMLSWKALQFLKRKNILEREIQGVRVFYKNMKVEINYNKTVAGNVDRLKLSAFLIKLVEKKGTKIRLGVKVSKINKKEASYILKTKIGNLKARYIVGADGYTSIVSKSLFNNRRKLDEFGSTYQITLKMDKEEIDERIGNKNEFYYGEKYAPGGYMWIFPHKNVVKVGYGAITSILKQKKINMREHLKKIIKKDKNIREKLLNGKVIKEESWPVPLPKKLTKMVRGNAILIGDAAHLVDPITGEGIHNALISGWIAGYYIAKSLKKNSNSPLRQYQKVMNFLYGIDLKVSRILVDKFLKGNVKGDKTTILRSSLLLRFFKEILIQRNWPPILTKLYLKPDY